MQRGIQYPGSIPLDTDILSAQLNPMVALGYLAQATLGTGTIVDGLACTPTSPASMVVNVAPGVITLLTTVDSTAYGSLGTNSAPLLKMGINTALTAFTLTAPTTSGQSINYLIEAEFQESDGTPVVLPYYNAANPAVPYSGPSGSGTAQNTVRAQTVALQLKPGAAATTGTQTTPAVDSGWTGLYVITVNYGATTVTAAAITTYPNAPFLAAKLGPGLYPAPHGQCYFGVTSSTVCTLMPQNGNLLTINGVTQTIPSAGITLSSTGLAATTLYYVYAYVGGSGMTLEASTTSHALASNGVRIKSGDATRTLVGMVYCFTAATFPTTANQIGALSYFNRKRRQAVFQQTTGGGVTNWTSSVFVDVYPTANISILTWGDETPFFMSTAEVTTNTSNASVSSIITVDGVQASAQAGWSAAFAGAIGTLTMSGSSATVSEGYHVMSFHANVSSGIGGSGSLMNQALVSG